MKCKRNRCPKRNLTRLQISLRGKTRWCVLMCVCVERLCPILGLGGVLVFFLLFPLVTLLFPRPPLYTTHPIRKAAAAKTSFAHTHTHTLQRAHTHMDPGGKSMLRRPCVPSYGAVVREMERHFHLRIPAANNIFRFLDAVYPCCCFSNHWSWL